MTEKLDSKKWGVSVGVLHGAISNRLIPSAELLNGKWNISEDTKKPSGGRKKN